MASTIFWGKIDNNNKGLMELRRYARCYIESALLKNQLEADINTALNEAESEKLPYLEKLTADKLNPVLTQEETNTILESIAKIDSDTDLVVKGLQSKCKETIKEHYTFKNDDNTKTFLEKLKKCNSTDSIGKAIIEWGNYYGIELKGTKVRANLINVISGEIAVNGQSFIKNGELLKKHSTRVIRDTLFNSIIQELVSTNNKIDFALGEELLKLQGYTKESQKTETE